jgi:RNA polymerase sigma-70 factor (ECF subfamily)
MAEDAASEVFLRVRDGWAARDGSVPMERWVLKIAANHCIDLLRRRRLERRWFAEEPAIEPISPAATPLTLVLLKEQRERVERSIVQLDEGYRVPLLLRYYAELSYDEIAAELELEKTQVAGRIFRAKQMLRVLLKEAL